MPHGTDRRRKKFPFEGTWHPGVARHARNSTCTHNTKMSPVVPAKSVSRRCAAHLGMWLWAGSMFFYFILSIVLMPPLLVATGVVDTVWLPLSARAARFALLVLLAPVVVSAALPIKRKLQPDWTVRLGRWIMRAGQEYLGLQTVYVDEAAINSDARATFLLEPHGVLPMSICGFVAGGLKTHPYSCAALSRARVSRCR